MPLPMLSILFITAVVSASPINSNSQKPHKLIIAHKDVSGEGNYKIIEIMPMENDLSPKNQSNKIAETTTATIIVQEPDSKEPKPKFEEKQELERILKRINVSEPEEQKYNEQNPETETRKLSDSGHVIKNYDILLKNAKPGEQKHDEQNPEPVNETDKRNNVALSQFDQYEPQYSQHILTKIIDKTHKGLSSATIIQIHPDFETLKHFSMELPQMIEAQKPSFEDSVLPNTEERKEPRYIVPEAPKFKTKISVPPLPISLSSIRSLKLNWPREVPLIFKAPRIKYIGHY